MRRMIGTHRAQSPTEMEIAPSILIILLQPCITLVPRNEAMVLELTIADFAFTRALWVWIKYILVLQEFFRSMAMRCKSIEDCRVLRVGNNSPRSLSLEWGPHTGAEYKRGIVDCLWRLLSHGRGPRTLLVHDALAAFAFMVYTRAHMAIERFLATKGPLADTAARVRRRGVRQMILERPGSFKGSITRCALARHSGRRIYSLWYKGQYQVKSR